MKNCYICGKRKRLSSFFADRTRRDGRQSRCKDCNRKNKKKEPEGHYLECPRIKEFSGGEPCDIKSPIVSEGKSHVFRCPEHGLFEIDESGDLIL